MVFSNNLLAGVGGQGGAAAAFTVDNSVMLDDGDTAYFSRTFGTPTNQKKWTYSTWIKRGNLGNRSVWGLAASGAYFQADQANYKFNPYVELSGTGSTASLITNADYVDPHAWYHCVVMYDSANSTDDERFKFWVNGVQVTSFSTETYPNQDTTPAINKASTVHNIGRFTSGIMYWDGYIAEAVFCDGQSYEAADFGEWNNGVWRPKDPSGLTFGDNGFYLDFKDSSDLGNDVSGNNNDWTANNLAAGDQSTDTPTNNQCVLSPIYKSADITLSQGNLKATGNSGDYDLAISSMAIPESGKWVCEFDVAAADTFPTTLNFYIIGVTKMGDNAVTAGSTSGYYLNIGTGEIVKGSSVVVDTGGPYNGTFRVEYDADNDTIEFFDDGTEVFPASTGVSNTVGLSGEDSLHFGVGSYLRSVARFSNLSGTPSTGFKELSAANLDTPTIEDSSKYFQTVLYQGTGAVRSVDQGGASYFNKYGSGNRTSIIIATGNGGSYSPAAGDNLINGNLTDGPGITSYADDMNFLFQFDEAVHITEATIYFQSAGGNLGTWKWQGSNNNSDYTDVSSNEDLTSAAVTNVITLDSIGASDSYTFYRLIKVSGGSSSTQWEEFNFKVKPVASEATSDRSSFKPDDVWIKNRSQADDWKAFDRVQTAESFWEPNDDADIASDSNSLTSFDTDGFTLGSGANGFNDLGEYFVSYMWSAGGGASQANENGSINTTNQIVSSVTQFSISKFTGTGANATVGHGLSGVDFLILKHTDANNTSTPVWHSSLSNSTTGYLFLDKTNAEATSSTAWNSTAPSSTLVSLGSSSTFNASSQVYYLYCWKSVIGFSKFGKYYGTGSATIPPLVSLGFKPSLVLIKKINSTGNWLVYDNSRSPNNEIDDQLLLTSAAETTGSEEILFLSNGFAPAATDSDINTSAHTYIYAAWANNPFGGEDTTNSTAY